MALINRIINQRNYEIIRDRIGAVLALELLNQESITYDELFDTPVFIQRSKPVNQEEERIINVSVDQTQYSGQTVISANGNHTFFIDAIVTGFSTDTSRGDTTAAYECQRLSGVLEAILEDPQYITLGFEPGFIGRCQVTDVSPGSIERGESTELNVVRITYTVLSFQQEPTGTSIPLLQNLTTIYLNGTEFGFQYVGGTPTTPVPPAPRCRPVKIFKDNVFVTEVNSGSSYYYETQCDDSTFSLIDEVGNVLQSGSIPSGENREITAPNASVQNSDTSYSNEILSGGNLILPDITITDVDGTTRTQPSVTDVFCSAQPATVTVNNNEFATVRSGETINVPVVNGGSNPVGVIDGGQVVIGNSEVSINGVQVGDVVAEDALSLVVELDGTPAGTWNATDQVWEVESAPCDDATLTLDSEPFLTVASGSTTNITLEDEDGNPVAPIGSDGSVIVVANCEGGATRLTAQLMKTGQTITYATGDDGDIEEGRDTDFLTLDSPPLHNDGSPTINTTTNRFTDTLGGQTYANNIVLDWSTWNGVTILAYTKNNNGATVIWNTAIDNSVALSLGGFTSGWRLTNRKELENLINEGVSTGVLNFAPFSLTADVNYWTSTTPRYDTTRAFILGSNSTGWIYALPKASASCYYLSCRTMNLSTSNILS